MFGISWAEFAVIFFVAVLVIPARRWPDVARFLARAVKTVRAIIWKITDASEQIKERVDLEAPINDIIGDAARDVLNEISVPIKKKRKNGRAPGTRKK
ncbi:MAG: twin-arginine translocase TatA/TatE family subunit [Alphaproteobacteria bacterium]|nr:twin-arginine translocase TatA/TatE family subunit [Alphaproteobacteria bacterium]